MIKSRMFAIEVARHQAKRQVIKAKPSLHLEHEVLVNVLLEILAHTPHYFLFDSAFYD